MCKIGQSWFQAAVLTLASNSSNSTINSTTSSNNTTNSTNSSNSTSSSIKTSSDAFLRGQDIQQFTKVSSYINFLTSVVGSFPSNTVASSTNVSPTPSGSEALSSLSVASVLLLSLLALIQTFGLE